MPAKKHNFTLTEIKAGVMVIVSLAVLGLFVAAITGMRPPEKVRKFNVYFKDTAGLNKGADVRFGGTKVGRVNAIELDPTDKTRLRVEAAVREGIPVNEKSEAFITQITLTSEKHLEITTGEAGVPLTADNGEIKSRAGSLFDQADELVAKVQARLDDVKELMGVEKAKQKEAATGEEMATVASIMKTVDSAVQKGEGLVGDVRDVVSEKKADVTAILDKVKDLEDEAKKLVTDVDATLAENRESIKGALGGVKDIVEEAKPIIERVASLSDRLDEIADLLEGTLKNTEGLTGEAGGLIADNRPAIEDIIIDLRETVRYLKTFSRTMAEQPEAVIRGKNTEGRK